MPLRAFRSHPSPLYRLPGTALVLIACGIAVLVTVGLSAVFAWRDREESVRQAAAVAGNVSLLVADHTVRLLETSGLLLTQAALLAGPPDAPLPTDRASWEKLSALAAAVPSVALVEIRDAAGAPVLSTRGFPAPPPDPRDSLPATASLSPVRGTVGEQPYVLMSRPLTGPGNGARGTILVGLSPQQMRDLYRSFDVGYGHSIALKTASGEILARQPEGNRTGGNPPLPSDISVSRRVDGDGLTAEVTIATSSILLRWRDQLWTYAAYALAAVATVVAIGALAIQRARREREAEDALQHAYDTLEENVHRRTAELEAANAQLENALSDKEILLKEVQHRVKNNLQVICSLLRLQAARIDEQARRGFDESLRRIQSLSLLHELLYRAEQPARINLADYLRQLCDGLVRSENPTGARLVVEAQNWTVDVDQATPLALICSELVSNALLHAFPDGHAGTVTVQLEPVADTMCLTIRDDGVGLPPGFPAARPAPGPQRRGAASGLGLVLVQALATQAGAALRIDRTRGTAFVFTIPTQAGRRSSQVAA